MKIVKEHKPTSAQQKKIDAFLEKYCKYDERKLRQRAADATEIYKT